MVFFVLFFFSFHFLGELHDQQQTVSLLDERKCSKTTKKALDEGFQKGRGKRSRKSYALSGNAIANGKALDGLHSASTENDGTWHCREHDRQIHATGF